jgi:hypothetical protein
MAPRHGLRPVRGTQAARGSTAGPSLFQEFSKPMACSRGTVGFSAAHNANKVRQHLIRRGDRLLAIRPRVDRLAIRSSR